MHGDLRYAHYPIVVGHYEGDTIIGARPGEENFTRLDALRGRLAGADWLSS